MAKSKSTKGKEISVIVDAIEDAKSVVFANFAGLNVSAIGELRRQCREAGVRYNVAKKTLLKIAFEKVGITSIDPKELPGGVAVILGYEDEVSAAKLLREFAKDHEELKFVGGLIPDGDNWRYLSVAEVRVLSKLPGKQELMGQVVGTIVAPLQSFVGVMAGTARSLVQVLGAVKESKS